METKYPTKYPTKYLANLQGRNRDNGPSIDCGVRLSRCATGTGNLGKKAPASGTPCLLSLAVPDRNGLFPHEAMAGNCAGKRTARNRDDYQQ